MKILALIPARMGSSRFPGKPMALIDGKPMIGRIYEKVFATKIINNTVVATCDKSIHDYIVSIGGSAVMTSPLHERAADRCAEALLILEKQKKHKFNIVVMVQGDEPMVHSGLISKAVNPLLLNPKIMITNILGKISNEEEFRDKNCIKAVCDLQGNALYFSREPIPTNSRGKNHSIGKQICVISFRRNFLIKYTKLIPTPLEKAESIDMLRILEHGFKIKMIKTNQITQSVDIPDDIKKVESLLKNDKNS